MASRLQCYLPLKNNKPDILKSLLQLCMEIYGLKPIKFLTWHILWPIYTRRPEGFAGPKENIALNMFEALKNKLKLSEDRYLALSDHIHQIEIPAKT
ncbi:hypothetical protein, partial [Pedobacter sp. UBA5917]|uniref:hypothetical protein n=1 Tax=Pedobacter sp. UBA5917 TaxID=1947061 RepID=UPI0025F948E5